MKVSMTMRNVYFTSDIHMPCEARDRLIDENSIKLSFSKDLDVDNEVKLNLTFLKKYFEVNTLDEILQSRRNEFQTRREHLQKRQEALQEKEMMFKERILSYEMYIKELAMKRERSLRRISDEKLLCQNKRMEMDFLQKEIGRIQEENRNLQKRIFQYQPHLNLLTQIVDQTDRFHSIEEMIDKFDMLYASYQDILITITNSNEELNHLQRQLLLTNEKKTSQISFLKNRIQELEQNLLEIQQRIEKIQTDIRSYQQISTEYFTENGAIKIAIESMFDIVKRYSHRSRKKGLTLNNQNVFHKLNQIDIFLSDLMYYVDYVKNNQKKILPIEPLVNIDQGHMADENNQQWRGSCQINHRETLIKHDRQAYLSYKIRGEDKILYTIQVRNIDQPKPSETRASLSPNRSTISMLLRSKEKKNNSFTTSTPKLQRSIERSPTTRSTFQFPSDQSNNPKLPFSASELTPRTSILTNEK